MQQNSKASVFRVIMLYDDLIMLSRAVQDAVPIQRSGFTYTFSNEFTERLHDEGGQEATNEHH